MSKMKLIHRNKVYLAFKEKMVLIYVQRNLIWLILWIVSVMLWFKYIYVENMIWYISVCSKIEIEGILFSLFILSKSVFELLFGSFLSSSFIIYFYLALILLETKKMILSLLQLVSLNVKTKLFIDLGIR